MFWLWQFWEASTLVGMKGPARIVQYDALLGLRRLLVIIYYTIVHYNTLNNT